MNESSLPNWEDLGFHTEDLGAMNRFAHAAFASYRREYARLDRFASDNPDAIRYPAKADEKIRTRIRKNYALDRCRYFLPFALKTNVALVQSARMWTETISGLLSSVEKEARDLGQLLRQRLQVYAPNLSRHAREKPDWALQNRLEAEKRCFWHDSNASNYPRVTVFTDSRDNDIADAIKDRPNRYGRCGAAARDTTIRCVWPRMAIAEIRDLNRHRTGNRFADLSHVGFYAAPEIDLNQHAEYMKALEDVLEIGLKHPNLGVYCRALGSMGEFRHTMQFDKFVYTAELRTGTGAHFKYAHDYSAAVDNLANAFPLTAAAIRLGEAEPE